MANALTGATLLTTFKATVDSFLLVKSFFDNEDESGLRDLTLHYHYQCQMFRNWGDRHNIHAPDCDLLHESENTKKLVLSIIERMRTLQDDGRDYISTHNAGTLVENSSLSSPQDFLKRLDVNSKEVKAASARRSNKEHKRRVKWSIINKAKFTEVVRQMERLNQELSNLLGLKAQASFEKTLPSRVLASLDNVSDLHGLEGIMAKSNFIMSHTTKLKKLEISADHNEDSVRIALPRDDIILDMSDLNENERENAPNAHFCDLGRHKDGHSVWVEWRLINEGFSEAQNTRLLNRIRTLGEMLSSDSTKMLRTAQCIGVIQDEKNRLRYGLVFKPPERYSSEMPVTLLQIIDESRKGKTTTREWMSEPPLGHKFELSRHIASSLVLFHASRWLHKAFRSDNILFFGSIGKHATLLDPYVAGFENSRHHEAESLGYRPTGSGPLDYFYHPDAANGFSKAMDLYSLGVILLELAMWRPLTSMIRPKHRASLHLMRDLFVRSAREILPSLVGTIYANVVIQCLECNFPDENEEDYVTEISSRIISQLDKCRA